MRINVGIRRRLAPLVDNNRRRIELLNSLLLSFPGTPILYYGDEIGMGDNIYLGDRNGVRTPMQWNSDRNAGFSKAVPAKLYFPVIMDPIWGYQAINVEAQQSDPSSLLHWTRNMIALRKLFRVFGRGTLEFLDPENRKVLAYIRRLKDDEGTQTEIVLCVANLSRFAQPVSLDLGQFDGMMPVEMLGYVPFPPINKTQYALTLSPYSFLWLELQPAPERTETPVVEADEPALGNLDVAGKREGINSILAGPGLSLLQQLLPTYLQRQRWFGAKSRTISSVEVIDSAPLPRGKAATETPAVATGSNCAIVFLQLVYDDEATETYQLPLCISSGEAAALIRENASSSVIATLNTQSGPAILHDGTADEGFRQRLLDLIERNGDLATATGRIRAAKSVAFDEVRGTEALPARTGSAEQSNTSILYGGKLIMKLFRRLQPGENPDTEIGRFLTEVAHFPRIAPFLGDIRSIAQDGSEVGEATTVAMLQSLVQNEGDGWQWTLDELSRYYDTCATCPMPESVGSFPTFTSDSPTPGLALEHAGLYLDGAALLGRRTAEMHIALATPTENAAFRAEPFSSDNLAADATRIETQILRSLEALRRGMTALPVGGAETSDNESTSDSAALVLSQRRDLISRARMLTAVVPEAAGRRIRIHGDYHLGQTLRAKADFVILDFEGEPARTLEERRTKQSPLKDVAGMLRSFSYAAYAGLGAFTQRHPPNNPNDAKNLETWTTLWLNAVSTEFLRAYKTAIAENPGLIPAPAQAQALLNAYMLEKALYELLYELNNRPAWVRIPLVGIRGIVGGN